MKEICPVNILDKLPRGYTLLEGSKELYREGDILELEKGKMWAKLSGASELVRKKHMVKYEVPVYRKGKK